MERLIHPVLGRFGAAFLIGAFISAAWEVLHGRFPLGTTMVMLVYLPYLVGRYAMYRKLLKGSKERSDSHI